MIETTLIGFGVLWASAFLAVLSKSPTQAWRDAAGQPWNHRLVWTTFAVATACNLVLVPGCVVRRITGESLIFVLVVQSVFVVRLILARLLRETGPGWLAYSFLIWMSPCWIPVLINLRFRIPWDMMK